MARGYPDYEGNKVGLYEKPEWAAFEGRDKNFYGSAINQPPAGTHAVAYLVPAGKTFYLTTFSWISWATEQVNRDNNQITLGYIWDSVTAARNWSQGGNGGGFATFSKPFVYAAGTLVALGCANYANHNVNLEVSANGYEI